MNILKTNYFVSAIVKTKLKNSGRTQEHNHNGIIPIWFFQRKNNKMLQNLTMMFANTIASKNKDLEVKEVTITSFNKV